MSLARKEFEFSSEVFRASYTVKEESSRSSSLARKSLSLARKEFEFSSTRTIANLDLTRKVEIGWLGNLSLARRELERSPERVRV